MVRTGKRVIITLVFLLLSLCFMVGDYESVNGTETANSDKSQVTVYLTITDEGRFVTGKDDDETLICRLPVTVDYFDLKDYGLEAFYRYEAEPAEEGGEYINKDSVLKQPTLLHLYIKAIEQYYLGGKKLEVGGDALTISGGPTSMYMTKFWGHDENLMYFVNHKYPLMRAGWGATADYILLEDGMEIDIAMFDDWSFYNHGAFAQFTPSSKQVAAGEVFTLQMRGTSTSPSVQGVEEESIPMPGEDVVYCKAENATGKNHNEFWETWDTSTDEDGKVSMSFSKPGKYFISSTPYYETFKDDNNLNAECVASPIAVVEVSGNPIQEDDTGTENLQVLKNLSLVSSNDASSSYKTDETFKPELLSYIAYIPDNCKTVVIKPQLTDEAAGKTVTKYIRATYRNSAGQEVTREKEIDGKVGLNLPAFIEEGENGNTVSITAICGKSSQTYTMEIKRVPSLKQLKLVGQDGEEIPCVKETSKENSYVAEVKSKTQIKAYIAPTSEGTIILDGKTIADGQAVNISDGSASSEHEIKIRNKAGLETTYKLRIDVKNQFSCTFTNLIEGSIIQVMDSEGNTVLRGKALPNKEEFEVTGLVEGKTYDYRITKNGYLGRKGVIEGTGNNLSISGRLEKANENTTIKSDMDSLWPSFRGNSENNGLTPYKTPITADKTQLLWAERNGAGGWNGAPNSPIIVDDSLIFSTSTQLVKVDKESGKVVAKSQMAEKAGFSIISPTYAEGMIFVSLSNGIVQAFNADTLEPLWIYKDKLKGQPNSPIMYRNGYIYTGFWNGEEKDANYVCLSITDEDVSKATEEKIPSWTYRHRGGFYWAGAYVTDEAVIVGSDNGVGEDKTASSSLYSFDPETGDVKDEIKTIKGDIRSSITYDLETGKCCFTSKGKGFYTVELKNDGRFKEDSLKEIILSGQSTSTPVVSKGRAYIGVSGTTVLGTYVGHCINVIDIASSEIVYSVETRGYPQTSGILTSAYEAEDGYNYIYFIENYTPGILRVIKDKPGQTKALHDKANEGILGEYAEKNYADTLFTPRGSQAEFAICSIIVDEYGTMYFKNDSAHMMAVGSKVEGIEIIEQPKKTEYENGEVFDPTGMKVVAHLANGMTKDVTNYVTYSKEPLTDDDLEVEISYEYVMYNDREQKAEKPKAYVNISSISEDELAVVRNVVKLIDEIPNPDEPGYENSVIKARTSYNEAGAILQKYVSNKYKLIDAETNIAEQKLIEGGKNPVVKAEATRYDAVRLEWDSNKNADGYEIYKSLEEGKLGTKIRTITNKDTLSMTAEEMRPGQRYFFTVRPFIKVDGQPVGSVYSAQMDCSTAFDDIVLKASSYSYNSIKLTWNTVSGVDGYEISRYDSSKKKYTLLKNLTSGKTATYLDKSLYTGTTYSYKITGYRNSEDGKIYTEESNVASVSPKLNSPSSFKATSGKKLANISWSKVTGASGYVVYRSTSAKSGFKAVKTIGSYKTVKYKNTKLKKGKTYYFKMRAYRTVKGKKVYSTYTSVKKVKIK